MVGSLQREFVFLQRQMETDPYWRKMIDGDGVQQLNEFLSGDPIWRKAYIKILIAHRYLCAAYTKYSEIKSGKANFPRNGKRSRPKSISTQVFSNTTSLGYWEESPSMTFGGRVNLLIGGSIGRISFPRQWFGVVFFLQSSGGQIWFWPFLIRFPQFQAIASRGFEDVIQKIGVEYSLQFHLANHDSIIAWSLGSKYLLQDFLSNRNYNIISSWSTWTCLAPTLTFELQPR